MSYDSIFPGYIIKEKLPPSVEASCPCFPESCIPEFLVSFFPSHIKCRCKWPDTILHQKCESMCSQVYLWLKSYQRDCSRFCHYPICQALRSYLYRQYKAKVVKPYFCRCACYRPAPECHNVTFAVESCFRPHQCFAMDLRHRLLYMAGGSMQCQGPTRLLVSPPSNSFLFPNALYLSTLS